MNSVKLMQQPSIMFALMAAGTTIAMCISKTPSNMPRHWSRAFPSLDSFFN
jgi:hypothetical protein